MTTLQKIAGYGWIPDRPDHRDLVYRPMAIRLDQSGSLVPQHMPPVFNQGRIGSCTGCSTSRAERYLATMEGQSYHEPSALFAYYNGRLIEGSEDHDAGAMIRDVIKGLITYGLAAESLHPYNLRRYSDKPSDKAYEDARFTALKSYERIDEEGPMRSTHVKSALAGGWPVVFGFTVYENFETLEVARTGLCPMPQGGIIGGHAVWVWQWDNNRGFRIRNSWGSDWGINGDFWMPFEYMENPDLVSDLWVLKAVT